MPQRGRSGGLGKMSQQTFPQEMSASRIIEDHIRGPTIPQHGISQEPLEAWQLLPEIPEPDELMAIDPSPLPTPLSEGEAPTRAQYLEFQYALQRYEGTELLRRAVNQYRGNPAMVETDKIYVYSQVHIQGYIFMRTAAACRISFSTERSPDQVNWSQSDRLAACTLVALSPATDNFATQCYVAVVASRYLTGGLEPDYENGETDNTPPRIEIFWADSSNAKIDPSLELVMLEAKGGFFESVRFTMTGLQMASFQESKFDKYFVEGCRKNSQAEYLQTVPRQTACMPQATKMFDASQMEAFQRMTSCELAIVQGPPGTGKTFTSVVAIQSYVETLKNSRLENEPIRPVIIAAQTNHALDQLLERCIAEDMSVMRLGSRCKLECIKEHKLFEIRKRSKAVKKDVQGDSARKSKLQEIQQLLNSCFSDGLVSAEDFHRAGLISDDQFESLKNDEWEGMDEPSGGDPDNEDFMERWLEGQIDRDRTYVYNPPRNQRVVSCSGEGEDDGDIDQPDPIDDEDDEFRLQGDFVSTEFIWTGAISGPGAADKTAWFNQAERTLKRHSDLYNIKPPQRGLVYRCLRQKLVNKVADTFPKLLAEYDKIGQGCQISRWTSDVRMIQHEGIQVVGCTTTGLTKYRGMIAALKPRVLMIEEAAETREANITSALYPSLDQVVLVGDHQQLQPHTNLAELEQPPYNLRVSLFERLVRMNLPYSMLRTQRRMIPAIREVVHAFYPALEDHVSVKNRPPIPGMGGQNLWWFQHQWKDQQDSDSFSRSNMSEALMIVGFVQYLVQNNTHPSQITILTYYAGQVDLITEKLRRNPVLSALHPTRDWAVRTVDGFQGEENDVILLSLVRSPSNPHGSAQVGFVHDENRAVVATSRARRGMYVFGNSINILRDPRSAQTWQKVFDVFTKQKSLGYHLPIFCQKHGTITKLKTVEDWHKIPGGGCEQACDASCPQGHPCQMRCHPDGQPHLSCKHSCEKILICGHACDSLCGDPCVCPKGCNQPAITSGRPELPRPNGQRLPLRQTDQASKSRQTPSRARGHHAHQVNRFKPPNQQLHSATRGGLKSKSPRGGKGGIARQGSPTKRLNDTQTLQLPESRFPREQTSDDIMKDGWDKSKQTNKQVASQQHRVPSLSHHGPSTDTSPSRASSFSDDSLASKCTESARQGREESLLLSFESRAPERVQQPRTDRQPRINETYIETFVDSRLNRITNRTTRTLNVIDEATREVEVDDPNTDLISFD